ncbi:hypothetical protein Y032_0007g3211 [Ancylostoma ceylanicum]|uniref:Uncharacterized protein n=1 Tax=Ancylostoma ceylanicum TaxID=53326 RepID=A0A016VNR3_9BILA|nr:hypothetical protein Y032_0007g3211 [Ancylostoma ceylanicum]
MVRPNPKRAAILELSGAGYSASDIVRLPKVTRQTVHSAIKQSTLLDRIRPGRPVTVSIPIEYLEKTDCTQPSKNHEKDGWS